jgi:hypothetical protein
MNPTKLILHLSDFSVILYAIYKNQQTHFTILVALLQGGPRKEKFLCNVVPGDGGRRGLGKFRRCVAGVRPGRVGKGSTVVGGLVLVAGGPLEATGARCTGSRRLRPPRVVLRCGWHSPALARAWQGRRGATRA